MEKAVKYTAGTTAILYLLLLWGCESITMDQTVETSNEQLHIETEIENQAQSETVPVIDFTEGNVGTSTITRHQNGISFNLMTSNLESGTVFSLWMIVVNDPQGNSTFDVLNSGGSVASGTGTATFSGNRRVGDLTGSLTEPDPVGLIDPFNADIIFIVRSHGDLIPGQVREMMTNVLGGCDQNNCKDMQIAVHD